MFSGVIDFSDVIYSFAIGSVGAIMFVLVATPAATEPRTKRRRPKSTFIATLVLRVYRRLLRSTPASWDRSSHGVIAPGRGGSLFWRRTACPSRIRLAMPASVLLNVLYIALIQRGELGSGLALRTK